MRKTLVALSLAAAAALATPALAQPAAYHARTSDPTVPAIAGVATGTVVGVGLYNGWWGATAAGVTLPTTAAASAAVGGVAGIGAVALIDAAIQPCRGFQALLTINADKCVDGVYVGDQPRRVSRR
jgi:hypothetical protein